MKNNEFDTPIRSFASPDEYNIFVKYIESKIMGDNIEEITPDQDYNKGEIYGGRWFKNKENGDIWRLVAPDFPFKGLWEQVNCI